jgi:hypothetical protein
MLACMGECGVCLITGFFCIFLCHPYIATEIAKSKMSYVCAQVNTTFYHGNLVFSSSTDGAVIVNTDYISNSTYMSPIQTAVIAPVTRVMAVQIPDGAPPGSTLTVQTPEGTQVVVTVPKDMPPGTTIQVQY